MPAQKIPHAGVDFIKCELESALVWARVAQTEEKMGESYAADLARMQAEQAYDTFFRFRLHVEHHLTESDRVDISTLEAALRQLMPHVTE
jgi:hypothetical protein